MVSIYPLISKSSNYNEYHRYFCSIVFFNFLARSRYLYFFSLFSVLPCDQLERLCLLFSRFSFLLTITRSGHLAKIRGSVCIWKSQRILRVVFSMTDSALCIYNLFTWSNLNFLHNSQWITLPRQSCLVLYFFCANLLHLLIMRLIVLLLFHSLGVFHTRFNLWYFVIISASAARCISY